MNTGGFSAERMQGPVKIQRTPEAAVSNRSKGKNDIGKIEKIHITK